MKWFRLSVEIKLDRPKKLENVFGGRIGMTDKHEKGDWVLNLSTTQTNSPQI